MPPADDSQQPSRARMIWSAIAVILLVLAVWKFIDYRTQPPPPPHPIGQMVAPP